MDLSKLPKLSESPAPRGVVSGVDAPEAHATESAAPPLRMIDVGFDIALLIGFGAILMMLGAPFGGWLKAKLGGQPYDTGNVWSGGPNDGRPVELFELQGGTGWLYAGEWVAGAAMIGAALLLAAAAMLKLARGKSLVAAAALCGIGVISNGAAAGAAVAEGVQPIQSLLLLLLCGVFGYSLMRHKWGGALT
ncbi:MAG TPA: hypothetical protein VF624_04940 [Tepidisphaeraceae bacterium]